MSHTTIGGPAALARIFQAAIAAMFTGDRAKLQKLRDWNKLTREEQVAVWRQRSNAKALKRRHRTMAWVNEPHHQRHGRERRNKTLSLMPRNLAAAYRREQAQASMIFKGIFVEVSAQELQLAAAARELYQHLEVANG